MVPNLSRMNGPLLLTAPPGATDSPDSGPYRRQPRHIHPIQGPMRSSTYDLRPPQLHLAAGTTSPEDLGHVPGIKAATSVTQGIRDMVEPGGVAAYTLDAHRHTAFASPGRTRRPSHRRRTPATPRE